MASSERSTRITIDVTPVVPNGNELCYELAQAKHDGKSIGIVIDGFTYDAGLSLVSAQVVDR